MLKDIILNLTEHYHNIGHNDSEVDAMMDSVSGMGHRIKHGHDMQGLIEAYHLQGFEGIELWFDHMLKDFTSPAGIPLPFAEAIHNITGMPMDATIDWLTVNIYDLGALTAQEAALKLFKNNKKAYRAIFLLSTAIGIIDDNPLVVVANTIRILKSEKGQKLLKKFSTDFVSRTMKVASKVCIGTATVTLSAAAIGINIPEEIDESSGILDALEFTSEASDIIEGISTLGLSLLVSKGVKKTAQSINANIKKEVQQLEEKRAMIHAVKHQLIADGSPAHLSLLVEQMKKEKMLTR